MQKALLFFPPNLTCTCHSEVLNFEMTTAGQIQNTKADSLNLIIMKNLKTTTIVFLFTSIFFIYLSQAQYGYKSKRANSVDLVVSGDIGYRLISSISPSVERQLENRVTSESFKFNYKAGFNFNFGMTKSLILKTGVRFANPGYSITSVEKIDFNQDVNNIVKRPLRIDDAEGFEYKVQYNLFQVPIGIKYVASKGPCEPYFELGVIPSFYGGTQVFEISPDETRSDAMNLEENINKVNFISFISAGGNYRIADSLSGFFQMTANYQINNLRTNALKERLVSVGLEMGLRKFL